MRQQYPRVARAFELYRLCRQVQLVHMELPSGKRSRHEVISWPTGLHTLPESGGLLDQSAYTILMFDRFLAGERAAAIKRVSK